MKKHALRFRQIHLDFHTSEDIVPIGEKFDKKQFQEALKRGHVNSITIFSKCHHGLSYHDTKIGKRHPGLDFELLPRQIEACREVDVKCPIYLSAGIDEHAAFARPEWILVNREGKLVSPAPFAAGWRLMGFDTPYLDYLCAQIEEAVENYDCEDGIFLDIIGPRENFSPLALARMEAAGVDLGDEGQLAVWCQTVLQEYFARTTRAAKKGNPDRPIFHNSGHIAKGNRDVMQWQSHLELESLPTGGWGYDHFPLSAKYAATTGYDVMGMTGKFHTTWGEFGGFKRPTALQYECAAMLAFGSKCSIGDQLHPSGEMSLDTYDLVGAAYSQVEARENWAQNVVAVSDIALISPEAARGGSFGGQNASNHAEEGASRMLLELGAQFDVVDLQRDLDSYKIALLPDEILLEGAFLEKIEKFVAKGGKLLLSGESGFNALKTDFALDLGLKVVGKSQWNPDYLVPTENSPTPRVRGPFVVYGGAWNVDAENATVLATRRDPYFNRAWNHFCSHQHTPDAQNSAFPGVVATQNAVYFAHNIFSNYRNLGQPLYRDLLKDALQILLPEPVLQANLPTAGRTALQKQASQNRYVLHLLFVIPQKRGADYAQFGTGTTMVELIEDVIPLQNIAVKVRVMEPVSSVRLVPSGEELPFESEKTQGGAISFVVPKLELSQMVELKF